jgi:metal-responsive CopG/Arc/MetJ family transcriptional regulator
MINNNDTIYTMKKEIIQKLNQLSDRINIQERDEVLKDIVQLKLSNDYEDFKKIKNKWNI